QDVAVNGHDVVDAEELVLLGIDVLGVTGLEVDRGGVVDVEGQTAGDAPGLLQSAVIEVRAAGRNAHIVRVFHQISGLAHRPAAIELVHPPRGKAFGVLRADRQGGDVGEVDVGAGADHPPDL